MYRYLLFALISLSIHSVFAQKRVREYTLNQPEQQVPVSLYDKLILLDKRTEQNNLGIVQVGAFNAKAQVIAAPPLAEQLQGQLNKSVIGEKHNGTLLMRLDKFCIAELTGAFSESGYFDFTAVIFGKVGDDSYKEIASIDTAIIVSGVDVTKKILNRSSQVVNSFIGHNLNIEPTGEIIYSFSDIEQYPDILKRDIPLYGEVALKDGLYMDYEEFKKQSPSAGLLEFKNNKPELGFYQKNSAGKLKKVAPKKYYAAVIGGQAYISCMGDFYLLVREDNDYYFTAPAKENASAADVVAASMFFGAAGAIVAQSKSTSYYYQKLDFHNGSFIKIEKR